MAILTVTTITGEYGNALEINLDHAKLKFHDGEPEDNTLGRNFNDCYLVAKLIKVAHELGLNGIPLEVVKIRRIANDDCDED